MQNYYEVLGISSDSSPGEIRKAYHRIALTHHPDKFTPGEVPAHSIEVFRLATEAYEVLRDKESRHKHDIELKQQKASNIWNRPRTHDPGQPEGWKRNAPAPNTTTQGRTTPQSYSAASSYSAWGAAGSPGGAASAANFAFKRSTFSSEYAHGTSRSTRTTTSTTTKSGTTGFTNTTSTTSNGNGTDVGAESGGRMRRPQHTRFSREEKEEMPDESRWKGKQNDAEEVVDLTEEIPDEASRERSPRRRRRSSTDASARKRARVFNMSSMRFVPPFTEKNGTSLHFEDLSQAMPYSPFRRNTGAHATSDPAYTNNTSTGFSTTSSPQISNQTLQTMLNVIVEATSPPLQKLIQLHNQRAATVPLPSISSQAVANNLIETHQALVELLDYTKQSIEAFNEQCRAGAVPPYR